MARSLGALGAWGAGAVGMPGSASAFWQFWTADDMLVYVEKYGTPGNATSILAAMDKAAETSWMMNIGQEKGQILDSLMVEISDSAASNPTRAPVTVLELGTFLGYSSIRIIRALPPDGKLITIEKDPKSAEAARKIITASGVDMSKVEILVGASSEMFSTVVKLHGRKPFDMIFMDHWKDEYEPDLKRMEKLNFVAPGTVVLADNVIVPGAPKLLEYFGYKIPRERYGIPPEGFGSVAEASTIPVSKYITSAKTSKYETKLLAVPFEYRPETPDAMSVSTRL